MGKVCEEAGSVGEITDEGSQEDDNETSSLQDLQHCGRDHRARYVGS